MLDNVFFFLNYKERFFIDVFQYWMTCLIEANIYWIYLQMCV